jgi:hypothetical protein
MNRQSYSRKIGANPIIHGVNKKFFGGLLNKAKDAISRGASRVKEAFGSLFSNKLP